MSASEGHQSSRSRLEAGETSILCHTKGVSKILLVWFSCPTLCCTRRKLLWCSAAGKLIQQLQSSPSCLAGCLPCWRFCIPFALCRGSRSWRCLGSSWSLLSLLWSCTRLACNEIQITWFVFKAAVERIEWLLLMACTAGFFCKAVQEDVCRTHNREIETYQSLTLQLICLVPWETTAFACQPLEWSLPLS